MAFKWVEAKSYDDMVRRERCVYGIVSKCSVLSVWPSANLVGMENQFAHADERLAKAALAAGLRLFVANPHAQHWQQDAATREEIRADLQRHMRSLPEC